MYVSVFYEKLFIIIKRNETQIIEVTHISVL